MKVGGSETRRGILFTVIGPSGVGKSSLGQELIRSAPPLKPSVSVTTRSPRPGELNGEHYIFLSDDEFDTEIREGLLFEWEVVHGRRYGTRRETLRRATEWGGEDLLLDIDLKGAKTFKREMPHDTVTVFLLPPDFDTLRSRILGRSSLPDQELKDRLGHAEREIAELTTDGSSFVDYVVVNSDRDTALRDLTAILYAERRKLSRLTMAA